MLLDLVPCDCSNSAEVSHSAETAAAKSLAADSAELGVER